MIAKILLIEDEGPLRENIGELLGLHGYRVITATDGRQGIAQAIRETPDLIICDILMPYQDGYEVLDAVRNHPSLTNTPFIFLTAKTQLADLRRGMNQGADDYLTKPFTLSDLTAAIQSRLTREQNRQQRQPPPTNYLATVRARDRQGFTTLQTSECLYFFMQDNTHCVLHPSGTYQIDMTLEELTKQLDPIQFFRANRNAIVHRKIVQRYAYWEKGKYCLYLSVSTPSQHVILPRARYSPFKSWLSTHQPIPASGLRAN